MILSIARFVSKTPLGSFLKSRKSLIRTGLAKGFYRKGGLGIAGMLSGESAEERFFRNLDLQGKTVYDVGGNIGLFSLFFSKAVGKDGKVILFEPLKANCDKCEEHFTMNNVTNVRILQLAAGDTAGFQEISFSPGNTSHATLDTQIGETVRTDASSTVEKVEIETLDGAGTRFSLPQPDFIKIDVEGYEYQVLQGMTEILSKVRPEVYIEIHGADSNEKEENIRRCTELLLFQGYSIYHVESERFITLDNCIVGKSGHIFCKGTFTK